MQMPTTTWDGKPVSKDPPFGCAIITYRRTAIGIEYLLLHRAYLGKDFAGDWAWGPPSGARLPGEAPHACAKRELWEETGLDLRCIQTDLGDDFWYVYLAEAPRDAEVRLSAEHDDFRWLSAEQAAAIARPLEIGARFLRVERLLSDVGSSDASA